MSENHNTVNNTISNRLDAGSEPGPMASHRRRWTVPLVCVVMVSIVLPWVSIQDHPLYPPDEGRYAAASRNMVETGNALYPVLYGRPHLTKPPLVYWLQGLGILVLGPTELAVRWPGLLAATLIMGLTLWLGFCVERYERDSSGGGGPGPPIGVISVALLAVMPLFVIVSRLAITDAVLGLFWFGALVFGYQALDRTSGGFVWRVGCVLLMWGCVALGLLTKGPLAASPIVVLIVWGILSGRTWHVLKWLQPWFGLPAAAVPVSVWVIVVLRVIPEAREIWLHETVDRATGAGEHVAPFLFYVPVFLAGVFPATAIMSWPWLNFGWRDLWKSLRSGTLRSLLMLSILVPLIGLSLLSGKLPTYVFPLVPSAALLSAALYVRWVRSVGESRGDDSSSRKYRVPTLMPGLAAICACIALGAIGYGVYAQYVKTEPIMYAVPPVVMGLPFLILPAVAFWGAVCWRRPAWTERRATVLLVVWLGFVVCVLWAYFVENTVRDQTDSSQLAGRVQQVEQALGPDVHLYWFGYRDPTLLYYMGDVPIETLEGYAGLAEAAGETAAGSRESILVLAEGRLWDKAVERFPELPGMYRVVGTARFWPSRQILLMVPAWEDALVGDEMNGGG